MSTNNKKKKRNPLNLKQQTRPRRDYIDYDYLSNLTAEEYAWLSKFTDEYYAGNFTFTEEYAKVKNKRKVFNQYDSKYKYSKKNIHNTDELRRDCYTRNDSIKRCQYNLSKITDKLDINPTKESKNRNNNHEDVIIDLIELKDKYKNK